MSGQRTYWRVRSWRASYTNSSSVVNQTLRALLAVLGLFACKGALAADIVVLGKLITNEPISYVEDECPQNSICLRSWWKSVIQVQTTVQGGHLSGRVAAAVMQHTYLNSRFKRAARLFVLTPIDDANQRAKLRVDYYLKEMAEPRQMFCWSRDPNTLGLTPEETYVSGTGDATTYCFELPGSRR